MKKIVSVAAVAFLGAIILPSCKKDYTCTCSYTANGVSSSVSVELKDVSKKDAERACEDNTALYSAYTGVTCTLD